MDEIVSEFINAYAGPEVLYTFQKGWKVLEEFEYPHWQDPYVEEMMVAGNRESITTLSQMRHTLNEQLRGIADAHGILLEPGCTTETLVGMLEGFLLLPDYEDRDAIIDICEDDDVAEDRFCELMELVTALKQVDLMACVSRVDPDFFLGVLDSLPKVSMETTETTSNVNYANNIVVLREVIAPLELVMDEFIAAGMPLGLEFEPYIKLLLSKVKTDFTSPAQVTSLSADILACALISSDGVVNPPAIIQKAMGDITGDVRQGLLVDIQVKKLLKSYSHVQENSA